MKKILLSSLLFLSGFSFGQVPNYVPTNGLVGWWGFNGNANDESGNGYNGTVNGATLTTDRFGNANSAYDFDGVGNYIQIPNIPLLNNISTMSISLWINVEGPNTNTDCTLGCAQMLVNRGSDVPQSNFHLRYNNNGTFAFQDENGAVYMSGYPYPFPDFIHVLYVQNVNEKNFYINGNLLSTSSSNGNISTSNAVFYFGYNPVSSFPYFINGKLDDVGIWNRALTQCEIQDLYNAQLNSGSGINAGTDQMVCEGSDVTLSGAGGSNYQWNNMVIDGVPFTPNVTQDYILTGEDSNGCLGSDTVHVELLLNSIGSETVTECETYTWITNGQTYTQSGQYTEVLTNQNGCDSTVTLDLTINSTSSSSQTDTGLDSYTWSVNNQTYTQSGTYTAVIPNASGCDSTITLDLTLQFTGLNENESSYVAIYPNPTFNSFTLSTKDMTNMNYTLVDLQGKVVLTGKIESTEETVDISKLSKGQYNLVFEDARLINVFLIIKE